jgi:hypothetical protein
MIIDEEKIDEIKVKTVYDYNLLQKLVEEYGITLLKDYSKEKINCYILIEGKCINHNCSDIFNKKFRNLFISKNFGCNECFNGIKKNKMEQTNMEKYGVKSTVLLPKTVELLNNTRVRYDFNFLQNFVKENNLILTVDYSKKTVNRETKIIGKCITTGCNNLCKKTFGHLFKNKNFGCEECSKIIMIDRAKKTFMDKYGVKTNLMLDTTKEAIKKTNLEKYGVEHAMKNNEIKQKQQNTNIEKYGSICSLQNEEVKQKTEITNLEKYGVKHNMQNQQIKEKIKNKNNNKTEEEKQNSIKKRLETNNKKSEEEKQISIKKQLETKNNKTEEEKQQIILKTKETNILKYGVEYPIQNDIVKNKIKKTFMIRYNITHPSHQVDFKEKCVKTNMSKLGVEHHMQNAEIAEKCSNNSYKIKTYTLPSGKIIYYQGYEHFALNELINIEKINENDIINDKPNVPVIWYNDTNGVKHRHYVDIYVPSKKMCIEVKSTWSYEKILQDNILEKQKAGKELGYFYEIWVYDKKGNKVKCLK